MPSHVWYSSREIAAPSDGRAVGQGRLEGLSEDFDPTCHVLGLLMQVAQLVLLSGFVVASCQAQTGEALPGSVSKSTVSLALSPGLHPQQRA